MRYLPNQIKHFPPSSPIEPLSARVGPDLSNESLQSLRRLLVSRHIDMCVAQHLEIVECPKSSLISSNGTP